MTAHDADHATEPFSEVAYRLLKTQIIRCELLPGARFTEGEISADLGLGKTPVREALMRLTQEQLVRNLPRIGYQVAPITLRSVRDTFGVRAVIEPAAIRLAAPRVDPARLRRMSEGFPPINPTDPQAVEAYIEANHSLHAAIAEASGNRYLVDIFEEVLDRCERFFRVAMVLSPRWTGLVHSHNALLEALEGGDGESAAVQSRKALLGFESELTEVIMSAPSVLAAEVDVLGGDGAPALETPPRAVARRPVEDTTIR